jgi:hypothetical protein
VSWASPEDSRLPLRPDDAQLQLAANLQGLQVERPVLVALEGQRIHTFAQVRELVCDRGAAVGHDAAAT